jgi:hypothetical protein
MKALLFPLLLLSIILTAQEKEKPEALPKKTDTLKRIIRNRSPELWNPKQPDSRFL